MSAGLEISSLTVPQETEVIFRSGALKVRTSEECVILLEQKTLVQK